jgi:hypothetical protein
MITNATEAEIIIALDIINKKYDGNVTIGNYKKKGNRIQFTLKVWDSHGPGHRRGFMRTKDGRGQHLINACWHVHGDFFDALFTINPKIWIRAIGKKITINDGNWQDRNIGSMLRPKMYSDACDCGWELQHEKA